MSVAELGKNTKGPVFRQVINKIEAKQNNDNEKRRTGSNMHVWSTESSTGDQI